MRVHCVSFVALFVHSSYFLLQRGLEPNVITYNAAISVRGKGRQPDRALALFDGMRQRGLEPNVITYNEVRVHCVSFVALFVHSSYFFVTEGP